MLSNALDSAASARRRTASFSVDQLVLAPAAPDAREREQVVDQGLHPLGAVDREVDVLVGALVELAADSGVCSAWQKLAILRSGSCRSCEAT